MAELESLMSEYARFLEDRAPRDHEVGLASLRSGRHSGATESWKSRRMRTVMSRAARVEMKRKGTIPWEKVKAELGLK